MILKPKYTTEDLEKARDLVDDAYEKLREARAINGTASVAWSERIDINGLLSELTQLSNGLTDRASDLFEESRSQPVVLGRILVSPEVEEV